MRDTGTHQGGTRRGQEVRSKGRLDFLGATPDIPAPSYFGFSIVGARIEESIPNNFLSCRCFSRVLFLRYAPCPLRFALSLDDFIRPREHVGRNCQTNLFCCLEVNDEFKLRRLLYW
jgi:hypothetical protein